MESLIVLASLLALVFGGFYLWARRRGLVTTEPAAEGEQRKGHIPLLTEAVAYVGAILLLAGGVAAVGQEWSNFNAGGHVAAFAGAAAFFLLVGVVLRRVREPAIQRLVSVAWFLSVVGVAGAAGYVTRDLIYSPSDPNAGPATVLGIGLAASLYSAALWLARRHALQNVALFAGLVIMICGVIATATNGHAAPLAYALALWGLGLAWAGFGWRRYLEPMWVAVPLGTLLALIAPAFAVGPYGWMYAIAIVTAAAAMTISVPLRNAVFLGLGAVAMFGYVTSVVVTYFHRSLGVPAALSITGALIVVVAVITARLMRAAHPAKPAKPGHEEPGHEEPGHEEPGDEEPGDEETPSRELPKAS